MARLVIDLQAAKVSWPGAWWSASWDPGGAVALATAPLLALGGWE